MVTMSSDRAARIRAEKSGVPVAWLAILWVCGLVAMSAPAIEELDAIVAVVNNDVIVRSELESEIDLVVAQLGEGPKPDRSTLERQVLERMVLRRLQLQRAEELGIGVDENALTKTIANIAARNSMTLEEMQATLEASGMRFADFREDTREQIITQRLQAKEVVQNVAVTEREVDRFIETEGDRLLERTQVRLGHILIAVPFDANEGGVAKARNKAERLVDRLRGGADFAAAAKRESAGRRAEEGGDLGWFEIDSVPSLVTDLARTLGKGEISEPLRSPSGFHIIEMTDLRYKEPAVVPEVHARHILIRTNELVSDDEARGRLDQLRLRIVGGADFEALARATSDDTGSSLKGGDLGWINQGDTVPEFEEWLYRLEPGEVSPPFKSSFGWHLVQVLERRGQDTTEERMRIKAREILRGRKADEAIDLWLQQLRDQAYVEVRLEEPLDES